LGRGGDDQPLDEGARVLTADEIGGISIFESLTEPQRDRLARIAADLRPNAGEFVIHTGEERALFAVLDGRLETVALVDGIERIVGGRQAGDLIGEVPISLGTTFPFSFRATDPSRLMRISATDYHAVVATSPEVGVKLGELARDRIGGLRGIAANQPPPRAIIVGRRSDPACSQLRRFLDRNQVTFRWITSNTPDAEELWGGPLPPVDDTPVIRLVNGKTVVKPGMSRVAELLGLSTEPALAEYDTVIIGAGPAGLAAAVYGASEGLRTIVVEREAPGGQAGTSSRIENYLGFPSGVSGDELAMRALQQARRLGAEILVTRSVERIDAAARQVHLNGGDVLRARTIILACGVTWRHLPVDGFDRLVGKGIFYGAARSEASNVHGLDVQIVGAGNSAGQAALFFANHASSVTILYRGNNLGKNMSQYLIDQLATRPNIGVRLNTEVVAVYGDNELMAIDVYDSGAEERERLDSGGLFIFIGADAETGWLPEEIALDQRGYVVTGLDVPEKSTTRDRDPFLLETSVPGIFACGDVRLGPVKRVAAAVGEGSMAIAFVHQYLGESAG
jgi:thioredoxin reductase (NADPH)